MDITDLALRYHALERKTDGAGDTFRRRARILQSMWREDMGYEIGMHRGRGGLRPLGSRLPMPWARTSLANFLTDRIRTVVAEEVLDRRRSRGKLYGKPRIFNDLLSSQPICFNLFGELRDDLPLATAVFADLTQPLDPIHLGEVTGIEFEYSPGRGDSRYLGDGTAFDVLVRYKTRRGGQGFLGIEVKYHENLRDEPSEHHPEYDRVSAGMACFADESETELRSKPLQQIWRDHLLAGAMLQAEPYEEGLFVFLRPRSNDWCADGVQGYHACLTDATSFEEWLLEDVVEVLRRHTDASWVEAFWDRYLAFEKVDRELARLTADGV